jgi:pyrroloquinoline quinone biosynthesis protein B
VGYRIVDEKTGGRLVVIPDAAAIDDRVSQELSDADLLLFDGTFFDEDELQRICPDAPGARQMGHVPISGADGSLAQLAPLRSIRRIYVHINNTNPILRKNSPQRASIEAAGIVVGEDAMEFNL